MKIINYNEIKDKIKKYSNDVDTNMWYANYSSLCIMDEIDIYNYLNKHKLKKFNAKKYAKERARVCGYSENCVIVYRAYSGANGDKGYKFYIK